MTAPVVTYNTECDTKEDDTRMQFILPSSLSNPPNPLNKNLEIKHREATIFAVMTFNGLMNHQESVDKMKEFVEILKNDRVPIIEPIEWEFWRFNPPWTVPWLRTNEIAVKLDKSAFDQDENENENVEKSKM